MATLEPWVAVRILLGNLTIDEEEVPMTDNTFVGDLTRAAAPAPEVERVA